MMWDYIKATLKDGSVQMIIVVSVAYLVAGAAAMWLF